MPIMHRQANDWDAFLFTALQALLRPGSSWVAQARADSIHSTAELWLALGGVKPE